MNHADRQVPSLAVDVTAESELNGILGELCFFVLQISYLYFMVPDFVVFMLFLCV